MATYNENRGFLQNCIQSILNQTYGDFEFLIVTEPGESNKDYLNDISVADNRIRVIENTSRLGVAASRNRAIKESRGKYVALIDGDDYCDVSRFEKQISFLENNPEISVVGSNMFLVDEKDNIVGERKYGDILLDFDISSFIQFDSAMDSIATIIVHPNDHPYDSDLVEVNDENII